jgi:hypothetical protein
VMEMDVRLRQLDYEFLTAGTKVRSTGGSFDDGRAPALADASSESASAIPEQERVLVTDLYEELLGRELGEREGHTRKPRRAGAGQPRKLTWSPSGPPRACSSDGVSSRRCPCADDRARVSSDREAVEGLRLENAEAASIAVEYEIQMQLDEVSSRALSDHGRERRGTCTAVLFRID